MLENQKFQFIVGTILAVIGLIIAIRALNPKPEIEVKYNFNDNEIIGIYLKNSGQQAVVVTKLEFSIDSQTFSVVDSIPYDEIVYSMNLIYGRDMLKANHIKSGSILSSGETKYLFFVNENLEKNRNALVCLISELTIIVEVKNHSGNRKDEYKFIPERESDLQNIAYNCNIRIGK
jgi:hypothetical protein